MRSVILSLLTNNYCNVAQIKENKATRKYFRKIKPNQRTAVGDTDTHIAKIQSYYQYQYVNR